MKRRRWFEIHSWLGVFAGQLLFVICWSGTVAVFAHEIDGLLDTRTHVPATAAVHWEKLAETVDARHPDAERYTLRAPPRPGQAAIAIVDTPTQSMQRIYLDPATGEWRGVTSYFTVQRFFRSLHMSLFDLGSGRLWGYYLVCAFSIVLLVSALTPLVFYRRWWRRFTKLEIGRGAHVFWSDVHKLFGVWSLAFAFLMALTGLWYLVEFFDVSLGYPEAPAIGAAADSTNPRPLGEIVAAAEAAWPALQVTGVTPAKGSFWGDVVHVEGQAGAWLVRDRANYLLLDPRTGTVLHRHDIAGVGWPARWVDTVDPLHFGDFGGLWSKAIWFAFGLLLSALMLTGAYLHVQRRLAGRRRGIWRGTAITTAATVAVLAIAAWGGWSEFVSYGPTVGGETVAPEVPVAVGAFVIAWCALTLAILGLWALSVRRACGAGIRNRT
jgi:uncharacterized iron-regulated membrane protein